MKKFFNGAYIEMTEKEVEKLRNTKVIDTTLSLEEKVNNLENMILENIVNIKESEVMRDE